MKKKVTGLVSEKNSENKLAFLAPNSKEFSFKRTDF